MKLASRKPAEAAPPPLGALAKLPVFFDLAGRRCVLAGGSAGAAWKAELIAAAGADVHVYATDVGPEMRALAERGAAAGRIILHDRPWSCDVFAGAAIAVADAEDDAEARAFACAALEAGVPCNVIDRPAFCRFQFGSIVNRSPVVVAISTDGAAPVLGQAIRRRIETVLPPSLSEWGALARRIRAEVGARLAKGPQRRSFWEAFADRAFAGPPSPGVTDELATLIADTRAGTTPGEGRVTLVGAGPGDAELLTLKAVRALQSADIVLYDDLVSTEVLELARREARRMMVGKRGQRESCHQHDINDLMVSLARQGRRVVRLKSGDPMIFGRGGEELERLAREGIAVDVVPGVTSASAMAAALGVSLTERGVAQSLRFVTGHAATGELPADLDWRALADPRTTLVVYMGGRTIAALARRLVVEGASPALPCAAVSAIGTPGMATWRGTLDELAAGGLPPGLANPVLIGIGSVFAKVRARAAVAPAAADMPPVDVQPRHAHAAAG